MMKPIYMTGLLLGLTLLTSCGKSGVAPRFEGRVVSHVDEYGSGTGGESALRPDGSMVSGFDYADPSKVDWTSEIKWYFVRRDAGSDVYRVEWTFRPKPGPGRTKTDDVSFDGTASVKVFENQWQVISIEPGLSSTQRS